MNETHNEHLVRALHRLRESDALRDLEARLAAQNAFNLFDAIGVSTQELRHSDFLAFLLRPHEAHGLGDAFLKWFLETALSQSPAPPLSLATLHEWDLSDAHIRREGEHIDLFITSAKNGLAVIVENKIYTGEHSDQLTRYMDIAKAQGHDGPGKTLLGVYLTPHGSKPSHPDYLPIGYETVCAHLEKMCKTGAFDRATSPDVVTVVRHYTRMLRSRKIVGDPEIAKLCRELYTNHQAAFDRVFADKGNSRQVQRAKIKLLQNTVWATKLDGERAFVNGLYHFVDGIYYFHFVPRSWEEKPTLRKNDKKEWHIYLQAEIHSSGEFQIYGLIAPCAPTLRERLLALVNDFITQSNENGYTTFYSYTPCLEGSDFSTNDDLIEAWQEWVETEGPKFATLIQPGDFPAA